MMKDKMMSEDMDVENVGIMQGFMDSMSDEDEDKYGEDEDESRPEMERRPNSPEILMNNLRGDMRSIDARRDELADLVGYAAATETPEPVLAMLQPILAQQGGLGALPQSQPMAQGPQAPMAAPDMAAMGGPAPMGDVGAPMGGPLPPGGIADMMGAAGAPPMPPGAGMPPPPAAPIGMARGGYVQHFQAGSNEEGVTPAGQSPSGDLMLYPPELVQAARTQMQGLLNQQPQTVPTLGALMEKRLPEYQKLLGTDKGRGNAEAQMLLELGQRAFNFASNTDDAGRPLRGGFAARLAGAVKTLPGAMGKHIEAMNNIDLKLKSLALQASEKDQDQVVAQNTELLKRKATVFGDILKAQAKVDAEKMKGLGSSVFGKGDWEWNVVNMPGLLDRYAAGQTDDKENNLINSAITKFKTPRFETHFDPVTKAPYTKQMPVMIPDFVTAAEAARKKLNLPTAATPALAPPGTAVVPAQPAAAAADQGAPGATGAPAAPEGGGQPQVSLWKERFNISGPISASIGFVSGIPGMGDPAAHITLARQQAKQQAERVVESLLKSTAGSVREQERLRPVIGIIPSATLDPDAYGTRLIALGSTLQDMIREYDAQGSDNSGLKPEDRGAARRRAMDLRRQYSMLGLPPAVYSREELLRYPPGTEVLVNGTILQKVKERE
jgi:hypothetical protein